MFRQKMLLPIPLIRLTGVATFADSSGFRRYAVSNDITCATEFSCFDIRTALHPFGSHYELVQALVKILAQKTLAHRVKLKFCPFECLTLWFLLSPMCSTNHFSTQIHLL